MSAPDAQGHQTTLLAVHTIDLLFGMAFTNARTLARRRTRLNPLRKDARLAKAHEKLWRKPALFLPLAHQPAGLGLAETDLAEAATTASPSKDDL
ncbi:MAG: hypothetical protein EOO29_13405 [Comamonadaceae bacterium]|nr:MAG: hypothetical protein EOO29_13405 [Comamonadaceae bacterium]